MVKELISRRDALKQLAVLAGSISILPARMYSEEEAANAISQLGMTDKHKALLSRLVDLIIPEDELPGALSLGVDNYVWVMVNDCLETENKQKFIAGMEAFFSHVVSATGKRFSELTSTEAIGLLNGLDENLYEDSELLYFLHETRSHAAHGYLHSEYIMTEIMPYKLVPVTYDYCAPIPKNQRANIHA